MLLRVGPSMLPLDRPLAPRAAEGVGGGGGAESDHARSVSFATTRTGQGAWSRR